MALPRRSLSGQELRELRQLCNLTQHQLADYLDVSIRHLRRWELGETAVPAVVAIALADRMIRADLLALGRLERSSPRWPALGLRRRQFDQHGWPHEIREPAHRRRRRHAIAEWFRKQRRFVPYEYLDDPLASPEASPAPRQ